MRRWTRLMATLRELFAPDGTGTPLSAPAAHPSTEMAQIRIVALLASVEDREVLARLSEPHNWTVLSASSCGEAWDLLNRYKAPIVICDREFPGAEWRDVIQMMSSATHLVYAILVSKVADDYLWSEVIRHGGYDLLAAPLREESLLRAVRLASSYWRSSMGMPPVPVKHFL
jgi:DNA-binding NtrC family response regulator